MIVWVRWRLSGSYAVLSETFNRLLQAGWEVQDLWQHVGEVQCPLPPDVVEDWVYIRRLIGEAPHNIPVNKFEWGPWVWLPKLSFEQVGVTVLTN